MWVSEMRSGGCRANREHSKEIIVSFTIVETRNSNDAEVQIKNKTN